MKAFSFKQIVKGVVFFTIIIVGFLVLHKCLDNKTHDQKNIYEAYYGKIKEYNTIITGSSTTYNSLSPVILDKQTNINSYNLATPVQSFEDTYYLLQDIYEKNVPETVILGINVNLITAEVDKESSRILLSAMDNSISKIKYFITTFNISDLLYFFNKNPKSFNINNIINGKYIDKLFSSKKEDEKSNVNIEDKGYLLNSSTYKYDNTQKLTYGFSYSEKNEEFLRKSIELCKEKGSNVILYSSAVSEIQVDFTKEFQKYYEYISDISNEYGIVVLDFNLLKKEIFSNTNEYFADDIHIRFTGAEIVSNSFGDILNDINNNTYDASEYFYSDYQIAHNEKFGR